MPGKTLQKKASVRHPILIRIAVCAAFLCPWHGMGDGARADAHLYVTGKVMEIDRCASAWLIKRHVDGAATFDFLTDEELMESKATQFDTPFAELQRSHRMSTFESVVYKFSIKDERVASVAALIHDIEINFWNKKEKKEVSKFEYDLKQIIDNAPHNPAALQGCFSYLDSLDLQNKP